MKRKLIPLTLMLVAGLVTTIITFIRNCSVIYKLTSLLVVFVIFFIIGSVIVYFLDYFDKVNNAEPDQEDEVIEKESEEDVLETEGETGEAGKDTL